MLVKWKCYLLDASIYVYSLHFIHSQFACCMSKWGSLNIFQEFAPNLSQFSRFFFVVVFVSPSFLISFCFSLKSGKLTIFGLNLYVLWAVSKQHLNHMRSAFCILGRLEISLYHRIFASVNYILKMCVLNTLTFPYDVMKLLFVFATVIEFVCVCVNVFELIFTTWHQVRKYHQVYWM